MSQMLNYLIFRPLEPDPDMFGEEDQDLNLSIFEKNITIYLERIRWH